MSSDQPSLREAVLVGVLLAVPGGLFAWIVTGLLGFYRMNGGL